MAGIRQKKTTALPWRQDFRDVQALPDLKIVRTHFLFSLLAVIFGLTTLGLLIYQQYDITVSRKNLAVIESSVHDGLAADRKISADSGRFTRTVNTVNKAVQIAKVPLKPERLLIALAQARLPQCRYNNLDYSRVENSGKKATLHRITIDGTMSSDKEQSAPVLVDIFVDKLRDLPIWAEQTHSVELLSSTPDRSRASFEFSIKIEWTQEEKK